MAIKVYDEETGNDYKKSDVISKDLLRKAIRVLVWIKNTGDKDIKFKLIASPIYDPILDEEVLKEETTLAPNKSWYDSLIQPWEAIWFEVKSAVEEQPSSARAYINPKGL